MTPLPNPRRSDIGDLQILSEDGLRITYRETRIGQDGFTTSILKVTSAAENPPLIYAERLANEYALRDMLDDAWAARPVALERDGGRTVLLLEDSGGESLNSLLSEPLEVERFLHFAIGIVAAVGKIHQRGIVHKDIKPANILINRENGEVWLTGFGIASRLLRERQSPEPPETIAGTLAYMAPEQTGRMNRSIDSRSDLYAIGVTFCEMLTGTLPFTASDPMEWVHCHIARRPNLANTIPAALSAIIMKLLAKNAEDRYQTAAGLEHDLRRCLSDIELQNIIGDLPLGSHDTPDRLIIPEKLYGRSREVELLLGAFDRAVHGSAPELVLVTGYSGVGKSALVNELHKVLASPRGLFASGKFDQYKRDIPYSTLAHAFQGLVKPLLGKSDAELAVWREALLKALDVNARLMIELVPELELIIGEQPPVPDLPSQQAQRRFQLTLRRFVSVFATPEHPLALFLDDLQWLDAATLDLLEDLLTQSDLRHLLLIGAYRDNEVDAAHPLARKLQEIRGAGGIAEEIALAPLARDDVRQLIADSLRCGTEEAAALAQLLHEKTGGNPFFAIQFLSELAEEELLRFDHEATRWVWDLSSIRAKDYTDNVVNLMVGKLTRLPSTTLVAVQQLACFGNIADVPMLSIAFEMSESQIHTDLWEALRAELLERHKDSYIFAHDRVYEAAYALIPESSRASAHLRIGRLLAQRTPAEQRHEMIFEIVNQLNRGMDLIADNEERRQLAEFNLIAGRRAKASGAYASACNYLQYGMQFIGSEGWSRNYQLTFGLWLDRAECECLRGNFEESERLIGEILERGTSKVDKAAAYQLSVNLHVMKSENPKAVEIALEGLRLFGIEMSPHPSAEDVDAEYQKVWIALGERSVESLIDLPPMADVEMQAAMRVLSVLFAPAYFTDRNLAHLHFCHMVNLTLRYGATDASVVAYGWFGLILGPDFKRYQDGYRFALLARDLVERHDLVAYRARVYHTMELNALWTKSIEAAIDHIRSAFRAGIESGDIPIACYACNHLVTNFLLRGDTLDKVWEESERGLEFARKAKFSDVVDIIVSQQCFIRAMQGRTTHLSTFSDQSFDEEAFEATLTSGRMPTMVFWYWVLKMQARFFSGDYKSALAAFESAKALLWSSACHIQLLDYYYYSALTIMAAYDAVPQDRTEELATCVSQLKEWSENYPPTFHDKYALVSAEVARLEGRDVDAMRAYEEAILFARTSAFIQNEALACELAARFYAKRGFDQIAEMYVRNARSCYARWGADGKVRQLDALHPYLGKKAQLIPPTGTMDASVDQLELSAVVKVLQTVSSELNLEKLLETLMRTALEQSGAVRAVLVLSGGKEGRIRAEATVAGNGLEVRITNQSVDAALLPLTVLHYTMRTMESVIIEDAAIQGPLTADTYLQQHHARSVLCVPLVLHGRLTGAIYLENNLTPNVFMPARITVLKLLASQAAISLENTELYRDLELREARIRRLVDANIIGIFIWNLDGRILEANDAFLRMVGYDLQDLETGELFWTKLNPPEWQDFAERELLSQLKATRSVPPFEKEYSRKDGSRVPVLLGLATFEDSVDQGVAFVLDLGERKQAEAEARESDRKYREAQSELVHANRVAVMGHLTASIAHEVQQPIAAALTQAAVGLRWLQRDPPDLDEIGQALTAIARDVGRAGDIINRIRDHVRKSPPHKRQLDINTLVEEIVMLTCGEAVKNNVKVSTDLADELPYIFGDRVELHQVMVNLILNAIEAISTAGENLREVHIRTSATDDGDALVVVRDTGPGLTEERIDKIFDPFYTTKPTGLGMGLSICRSIIEAHGGRLWASANHQPRGSAFAFTIPPVS